MRIPKKMVKHVRIKAKHADTSAVHQKHVLGPPHRKVPESQPDKEINLVPIVNSCRPQVVRRKCVNVPNEDDETQVYTSRCTVVQRTRYRETKLS